MSTIPGIRRSCLTLGRYPVQYGVTPVHCRSFTWRLSWRHAVLLATAFSVMPGCGGPVAQQTEGPGALPPIRVTAVKPQRKTLVRTVELPGRSEAFEFAPLHAKVTGYVQNIPVDIGDRVQGPKGDSPGSLLCELLVPELKEELAEKTAAIAQTAAEVLQAEAGVKVAEAVVRSADARIREVEATVAKEEAYFNRWQSEYQRVARLAETGAVNQKVADETRSQMDAADAARKEVSAKITAVIAMRQEAAARLEKARADVVAILAHLEVAEADKRRSETLLEYSVLRAPFDGVVVERNVHTGHLVQAGPGNGQKPMVTVMRLDPLRIFVDVPESDAVHVSKGSKVELRIPSLPAEVFSGTVTRTAWSLNTTSRTLLTEIDVPNSDGRWRPGLYLHVTIVVAELNDVFSLPRSAVVTQDKQTYCYSVGADGKVVRKAVSLGIQAGTDVEIRDGLTGEEQIITVNASSFREGHSVEIAVPAK